MGRPRGPADPEARERLGQAALNAAFECEAAGDTQGALAAYRQASELGNTSAQVNLANVLANGDAAERAEARRWYRRAARGGDPAGAWNLAMDYRLAENRRGYFRWVRTAARMGDEDAAKMLRMIEAIRARGQRAPMLFLDGIEPWTVTGILEQCLAGVMTQAEVRDWAALVLSGQAAVGLPTRPVARALEVLADASQPLTPERARELMAMLA